VSNPGHQHHFHSKPQELIPGQ